MITHIYTQENVGRVRYVVNFHRKGHTHADGSPFYDIATFTNKRKRDAFVRKLKQESVK